MAIVWKGGRHCYPIQCSFRRNEISSLAEAIAFDKGDLSCHPPSSPFSPFLDLSSAGRLNVSGLLQLLRIIKFAKIFDVRPNWLPVLRPWY